MLMLFKNYELPVCNLWSKGMIQDPIFQHFCLLVSSLGLVVETVTWKFQGHKASYLLVGNDSSIKPLKMRVSHMINLKPWFSLDLLLPYS